MSIKFEFDKSKSLSNKEKHGIDFLQAQRLWEDVDLLIVPARTEDEPRSLAVGRIDGKYWSAIFTSRHDRLRLISVRRSRKEEQTLYES